MCDWASIRAISVDPIDWNPLMLMTKSVERFDDFSKCDVKIFVYDYHIQIFLIFSLKQCTLFYGRDQIIVLEKKIQWISIMVWGF